MHRPIRAFAFVAASLFAAAGVSAAERLSLYQGMAFTTGSGEEAQRVGFAAALQEVLAKVSGDQRLIGDPRVAALGEDAAAYVGDFSFRDRMEGIPTHDEQGTRERPHDLTVSFDAGKIDAALAELGSAPWPEPRPDLVMIVSVTFGDVFILATDSFRGTDMRTALQVASSRAGLDVLLPTSDALAMSGVSFGELPEGDGGDLDALAAEVGGDHALAGSLVWNPEALGWVAEWRLDFEGETYRYGTSGVSFDGAFRNGVWGAAQVLSGNGAPE